MLEVATIFQPIHNVRNNVSKVATVQLDRLWMTMENVYQPLNVNVTLMGWYSTQATKRSDELKNSLIYGKYSLNNNFGTIFNTFFF